MKAARAAGGTVTPLQFVRPAAKPAAAPAKPGSRKAVASTTGDEIARLRTILGSLTEHPDGALTVSARQAEEIRELSKSGRLSARAVWRLRWIAETSGAPHQNCYRRHTVDRVIALLDDGPPPEAAA
jgi:hypothetical protein